MCIENLYQFDIYTNLCVYACVRARVCLCERECLYFIQHNIFLI